jgi:hypothetical protein
MEDQERQAAFETGVLPLLGLNTELSSTPPSSALSNVQLAASNQDIIRLFETYRTRVHPFHYITYDLERVEEKLCQFIGSSNTSSGARIGALPEDLRWLGLLHAILAAGAQFCDLPTERRTSLCRTHS